MPASDAETFYRNLPRQARSRERVERILHATRRLLAFVSGWHIWTMVCKCDLKRYVRTLRKMLHILVKQLGYIMITVDKAFPVGQRFAEFLGFRLTSEVDSIDNKTYCFYGMDKAWLTQ